MGIAIILGFVLAGVTAVTGGVVVSDINKRYKSHHLKTPEKLSKRVLLFGIVSVVSFFSFIIVPFGFYQVNTGEVALVREYGQAKEVKMPGLYWRFMMTTDVIKYNTKVQYLNIEKWCYVDDNNTTQVVQVIATIQYSINETKVKEIANKYGSMDALKTGVTSIVLGALETSASNKQLDALLTGTGKQDYQQDVTANLSLVEEDYFITFRPAIIEEFVLEPELETAKLKVRLAEEERKAQEEKNKQAKALAEAEAQIAKIKADNDAEINRILAEAQADVDNIEADAIAYRLTTIAIAEAEAIKTKLAEIEGADAEALKYLEYMAWVERWDGKLPETVLGDGIEIIIPKP